MSVAARKVKKTSRKGKRKTRDPKKDAIFRALSEVLLEKARVKVRREKLKQGHGWRAISGACRLDDTTIVFVDSKLNQDEQVEFLLTKLTSLEVSLDAEYLSAKKLPAALVRQLSTDGEIDDEPLDSISDGGEVEREFSEEKPEEGES